MKATYLAVVSGLLIGACKAVVFDIHGHKRSPTHQPRAIDMNGSYGNGSSLLLNRGGIQYSVNVTLGGSEFNVMIDTGRYALKWRNAGRVQLADPFTAPTFGYTEIFRRPSI